VVDVLGVEEAFVFLVFGDLGDLGDFAFFGDSVFFLGERVAAFLAFGDSTFFLGDDVVLGFVEVFDLLLLLLVTVLDLVEAIFLGEAVFLVEIFDDEEAFFLGFSATLFEVETVEDVVEEEEDEVVELEVFFFLDFLRPGASL
jgi:hypothetical protein